MLSRWPRKCMYAILTHTIPLQALGTMCVARNILVMVSFSLVGEQVSTSTGCQMSVHYYLWLLIYIFV